MNDLHAYDRFLFSLVTTFTRRARPHLRSLWADLMELEEAPDARTLHVVREQTLRRLQALGRAARGATADEVQALSRTLGQAVAAVTDVRDAHHQDLFDSLYQTMRELTEAVYTIQAAPPASEDDFRSTGAELVESCAD